MFGDSFKSEGPCPTINIEKRPDGQAGPDLEVAFWGCGLGHDQLYFSLVYDLQQGLG